MHGIDFRTVAGLAAFGFLALGLGLYLAAGPGGRGRGFAFCMAGIALAALSGLIEVIDWGSRDLARLLSYVGIAGAVGGAAFLLAGARHTLGLGVAPAWYFGVAGLDALALLLFRTAFPDSMGLRTIGFSAGIILLLLPVLLKKEVQGGSILAVFKGGLAIASLASGLRLLFATFDMKRDRFLPGTLDTWLYFSIIAAGMGSGAALVAAYARKRLSSPSLAMGRGKPCLRLRERGLSAKEILYLMDILSGQSSKEIANRHGVADSTVRNSLARAYRKLNVADKVGVVALTSEYDIAP